MSGLATVSFDAARRWCAGATAAACLLALAFGAPLPAAAQSNSPPMRLRVADAESGQPVPAVKVRAWVRANPTDESGVSLIPLPKPGSEDFSYRITLSKDGYVGQYITWSKAQHDKAEDIPAEFTAKLEKGRSIGGIVKNDKGEPVPGARVILSGPLAEDPKARVRSVVAPNYHAERTDADGKWQFGEAPRALESLTFHIVQPEYVSATFACEGAETDIQAVIFLPKADFLAGNAAMTLGHGIELSGRVLDAAGKPVAEATITRNHEWRNPVASLSTDTNGQFKISNLRAGEIYLTIQAKGLAAQTQLLTLSDPMPELKIEMQPGKMFQGRVVDPSGKPLAGATAQMDRLELGPMEYDWSATTDSQGRFSWDSAPEGAHPYCFSFPGYHPRTEAGLVADASDHVITLRPRTEGDKTMIDGQVVDAALKEPVRNFTVYVKEFNARAASYHQQTVSNADGRYSAAVDTAASTYIISIGAPGCHVETSNYKSPGDGDVRLDFALEKGEGLSGLLYCLTGRCVVNNYGGTILWTNQNIQLATVVPPPDLAASDPDEQKAEFDRFLETPQGIKWQKAHRVYDADVGSDGTFKIQYVPEGDYQLRFSVRESQAEGGQTIASLSTNIVVSSGGGSSNTTMDLGSLEISLKKTLRLADTAPPFEVKTVDGAPLRLADFRGKYVLLDFWATWCHPCRAETPFLKATYTAFGANNRFAMIGLSLDADTGAPKDYALKNDIKWTQAFLGDWSKATVPALYGVEGIPSIFLIGPDGKIVAEGLRGEEIKAAVGKALGSD